MRIEQSIDIAASPEAIWPFLVDPEKVLQWCITFQKFEYTGDQRSGVGTPLYIEEKAAGRLMKLNFETTEWVEHRKVAFRKTAGEFVKGYEQSWTVEATPSGARFTFLENVELPFGIIGKLMGLFARRGSEAHVREMLAKLKSLAEA